MFHRLLAGLAFTLLPSFACAHAILEDSNPEIGATIKPGPIDLMLRYNSRIDRARSRLTLLLPDHSREIVPIDPTGAADVLTSHFELPPGSYTIRWQVLAVDGHITRGDVPFTVSGP